MKPLFWKFSKEFPKLNFQKTEVVGSNVIDLISEKTGFLKSKGEAKRELAGNSISINKEKSKRKLSKFAEKDLIDGKFLLLQKGKKNYFIVKAV